MSFLRLFSPNLLGLRCTDRSAELVTVAFLPPCTDLQTQRSKAHVLLIVRNVRRGKEKGKEIFGGVTAETSRRSPLAFEQKECNYWKDQSQRNNVCDPCASASPSLSTRAFLSSSSFDEAEFKYRRKYSPFDFGSCSIRHLSIPALPVEDNSSLAPFLFVAE